MDVKVGEKGGVAGVMLVAALVLVFASPPADAYHEGESVSATAPYSHQRACTARDRAQEWVIHYLRLTDNDPGFSTPRSETVLNIAKVFEILHKICHDTAGLIHELGDPNEKPTR